MTHFPRLLTASLLLTLLSQVHAQTNPAGVTTPPKPLVAPVSSRLYAGANIAPSISSGNASSGGTAYGLVVGSSQLFGAFGAQANIDYVTSSGAISVDALLLYRPLLGNAKSKFQPYLGAGFGLTSSTAVDQSMPDPNNPNQTIKNLLTPKTATDYAAQLAVGSDYLLTDSIAANAELNYRSPFSSSGTANGAGVRGRLGIKFLF